MPVTVLIPSAVGTWKVTIFPPTPEGSAPARPRSEGRKSATMGSEWQRQLCPSMSRGGRRLTRDDRRELERVEAEGETPAVLQGRQLGRRPQLMPACTHAQAGFGGIVIKTPRMRRLGGGSGGVVPAKLGDAVSHSTARSRACDERRHMRWQARIGSAILPQHLKVGQPGKHQASNGYVNAPRGPNAPSDSPALHHLDDGAVLRRLESLKRAEAFKVW